MQSAERSVVLLGTGGTIAGAAARAQDHVGYSPGALAVSELVAAVAALNGLPMEAENLAASTVATATMPPGSCWRGVRPGT